MAGKEYRINEQIRFREVRVIGENGEQVGILPLYHALNLAREKGLDLVEVAPTAVPPVCRLLDYGKFRYEQSKREREARRAQKATGLREMRFRPRIATHDKEAKLRHVRELLQEGNKVKLTVMFRGREMARPELGLNLLRGLTEALKEEAKLESPPAMEGRFLSIVVAPIPKKPAPQPRPTQEVQSAPEPKEVKT